MSKEHPEVISSGIDALVARLHDDGVKAGQDEASRLVEAARRDAVRIRQQAEKDAAELLDNARRQTETERRAAEEALQVAFRDMVLDMKNQLLLRLSEIFQQRVRETIAEPEILGHMVVEAAGRLAGRQAGDMQGKTRVLLPEELLGISEIRDNPEKATQGPLAELAFKLRDELLEAGIELMPGRLKNGDQQSALRIVLNDGQMALDIDADTVSQLLMSYLQPRFQAILEGVIR
ncbi:MAG: hypothetical protein CMI02_04355 [Oceanospirillaceae bacterium]|nr:hypothetical protein [Oceanospirillaceae bacterium]MBT11250.1 hypothetical protein [Oceanospirillaceae bacterium]